MQALTLQQPWAWAVCYAGKRIENRSWAPPRSKWGPLAIHAGKTIDRDAMDQGRLGTTGGPAESALVLGAVVAVALLDGCQYATPEESDPQRVWWVGPYGWWLKDVVVLPDPVPCKGKQGLWPLPESVLERVEEGWAKTIEAKGESGHRDHGRGACWGGALIYPPQGASR